jgi:hypothetical protein
MMRISFESNVQAVMAVAILCIGCSHESENRQAHAVIRHMSKDEFFIPDGTTEASWCAAHPLTTWKRMPDASNLAGRAMGKPDSALSGSCDEYGHVKEHTPVR